MHTRQRSRLLGFRIILMVVCTLALAACNSGSGTSEKAPGAANTVTGAESTAPAKPATKTPAKGTLAEALAGKLKGAQ